jgi:malonyl-CoA O-methyltransferase
MNKETLIRNFSRYADYYDKYADVQKLAALKLLGQLNETSFDNVLEIGCGSGNYTVFLRDKFNSARLKAVDLSDKMVAIASDKLKGREVDFIVGDAENIELGENFGLITSNACFQWFFDLEKALIKYKDSLSENGVISFSIFGPETFSELNASLRSVTGDSVAANHFMAKEMIRYTLNKFFKEVVIEEIRHVEFFSCLKYLLDKIKYTGIRGEGLTGKTFFGPGLAKQLEKIYWKRFSTVNNGQTRIPATYQIFLCRGQKI